MCPSGIRGGNAFEICVMNADGTGHVQLTDKQWRREGKKTCPED